MLLPFTFFFSPKQKPGGRKKERDREVVYISPDHKEYAWRVHPSLSVSSLSSPARKNARGEEEEDSTNQ